MKHDLQPFKGINPAGMLENRLDWLVARFSDILIKAGKKLFMVSLWDESIGSSLINTRSK